MEIITSCILSKKYTMKKIKAAFPLLLFVGSMTAIAQSQKSIPPPPPPQAPPEIVLDKVLNDAKPKEPPVIKISGERADNFYKKNPSVAEISRQGTIITIEKKDGLVEKYDMSKQEEKRNFTDNYGASPIPPPPPPKIVFDKVANDARPKEPSVPPPPPPKPQKIKVKA